MEKVLSRLETETFSASSMLRSPPRPPTRQGVGRHSLRKNPEPCQHGVVFAWLVVDVVGIEDAETVDAAEVDVAVGVFAECTVGELVALQAVAGVKRDKTAGRGVEFGKTAIGAYPEVAPFVLANAADDGVGEPVGGREVFELSGGGIVAVESVRRTKPYLSVLPFRYGITEAIVDDILLSGK